ncbi:MAG: hypothetical protein ACLQFI_14040 [Methylocella sp.]
MVADQGVVTTCFAACKLKARKLGNRTLIDAADVRRYFESLPTYRPKLD